MNAPFTRRTLLTLCTAAGLGGLYGLYSAVVTPLISPGEIDGPRGAAPMPAPPPPPENVRMAELYLPSQPWAATAKYQFRTPEAFVYANEWDPAEENQAVRFRPFAMIFLQPNRRGNEPPVTVVGESAYLKFAKKFDIADPDPGRVIGGALQGNVRITGPDNLVVVGRNFIFSEKAMRLWSDEDVQFAWGSHRGKGYGLQIELIADDTATPSESIGITGVQSIRLRRNVRMDLKFANRGGDSSSDRLAATMRGRGPTSRDFGAATVADAASVGSKEENPPALAASATGNAAAPRDKKPEEPVEVRVRSDGSFEFDIEANVATFSDHVRVYRPTGLTPDGKEQFDSLQCDQLTLSFEPRTDGEMANVAAPQEGPGSQPATPQPPAAAHRELKDGVREGNFRNLDTRLEFRRARARGKHVVLLSDVNDLKAELTDLIYDVQTRVASLANPEMVRVTQGTSELRSPGVTLLHDPHGRMTSIWCQGPGWLRYRNPETGVLELAAQWMRQLRKYPEPGTGLDIIELEQQALVRQPEQETGLAADFIRLWMEQQDLRATRPGEARSNSADRIRLKRMLALKDVALVSPEMHGETNRLEVQFEERAEPTPPPPATSKFDATESSSIVAFRSAKGRPFAERKATMAQRPEATSQYAVSDDEADRSNAQTGDRPAEPGRATTKPGAPSRISSLRDNPRKPITLPKSDLVPSPGADPSDSAAGEANLKQAAKDKSANPSQRPGDGPIQVFSDLIRVRVVQGKTQRESKMEEVWTEGNVEVTQEHADGEQPLVITGDKLHLENHDPLDQVLHVSGVPAHIHDRGMHIEGRNVHLDRARNKAWVDGAGLLQLPVKSNLDGQKLEQAQILDVWWKEKMTFNGEYARFFGDVRSVLNDSKMLCQDMEVKLTGRISFTARERDREVKVMTVDCRDGVQFDSTEYLEKKLSEVRRGHVARFTLDQITGRTQAFGPGHIIFWRRGNGRRAALGPGIPATAARAAPKEVNAKPDKSKDGKPAGESPQWEYTRVDFLGKTDGNIQQRFTTFEERVNVVYGPVDRPLAIVDPDALPKDGGWMRCDKLRLQQHPADGAKKPSPVADAAGVGTPPASAANADSAGESRTLAASATEPPASDTAAKNAPKNPGHIELLGEGNAELEGRTFHAQADTISYDESKGLYMLRSFGNRKATIWRQKQVGGESSRADAQRMEFVPSRNQLKLDRTTGLDALQ